MEKGESLEGKTYREFMIWKMFKCTKRYSALLCGCIVYYKNKWLACSCMHLGVCVCVCVCVCVHVCLCFLKYTILVLYEYFHLCVCV